MTITPSTAHIKQVTYQVQDLKGNVLQDNIHSYPEAQIAALKERAASGAPVQIKQV